MSVDHRIEGYSFLDKAMQEKMDDKMRLANPVTMASPAAVSGTFYLKLLGVEGIIDRKTLHQFKLNQTISAGLIDEVQSKISMNHLSLDHEEKGHKVEREQDEAGAVSVQNLHYQECDRKSRKMIEVKGVSAESQRDVDAERAHISYEKEEKHSHRKKTTPKKKNKMDHIDDDNGMFQCGM